MYLILPAVGILGLTGLAALAAGRTARAATALGAGGAVAGCAAGLVATLQVLATGQLQTLHLPWQVPWGSFYIQLDGLSAFFLLPILGLSALAAVYGGQYLQAYRERKSLGSHWFYYNILIASMVMVAVARNGVLFLVAWEVMSLASFFLVCFEDEHESTRQAGWTYLIATHTGTAFLLLLFVLLAHGSGSMDFDQFTAPLAPGLASVAFLLAAAGFGTKAGFIPLHVWLPEAHPAAPSHVSAVMSGVMIKTGIYGLLRTLTFLGPPEMWWGWALVGVGAVSGVMGVLLAIAQHDVKRLLAYHSVENIGIITLGLGLGVLGWAGHMPALAVLGLAGGMLHVVNHALFKGLLFLGAGAVAHGSGTREIDHLGGLLKRMPITGVTFLIAAVAICGLPPLNGFVSEFLIYLSAFGTVSSTSAPTAVAGLAVIAALALIGGLAAACFTKAFGIIFLGEPRSDHAAHAHEAGWAMRVPMLLLAAGCVAIGLAGPLAVKSMQNVVKCVYAPDSPTPGSPLVAASSPLTGVVVGAWLLVATVVVLALVRARSLKSRPVGSSPTWDCGYARPTARMQYTASSFAQPLTHVFRLFLRTRRRFIPPEGLFPSSAELATETPDPFREGFFAPLFRAVAWVLSRFRWLQHGRVQLYVLYIALTLLILLVWKLGWDKP